MRIWRGMRGIGSWALSDYIMLNEVKAFVAQVCIKRLPCWLASRESRTLSLCFAEVQIVHTVVLLERSKWLNGLALLKRRVLQLKCPPTKPFQQAETARRVRHCMDEQQPEPQHRPHRHMPCTHRASKTASESWLDSGRNIDPTAASKAKKPWKQNMRKPFRPLAHAHAIPRIPALPGSCPVFCPDPKQIPKPT